MSTALVDITAADWSVKLGEPGAIVGYLDDINQCLRVILATPKGSRAHEPLFGCDVWLYLDRPFTEAMPRIIAAVASAIEEWEPRVDLVRVVPVFNEAASGHVDLQIEWKLKGSAGGAQQLKVTL